MVNWTNLEKNWEHLYTQFKNSAGAQVVCMMHKQTKKFIYFDVQSNRLLSKQEALSYRVDVTGIHKIHP
jgi:hypothetical protein